MNVCCWIYFLPYFKRIFYILCLILVLLYLGILNLYCWNYFVPYFKMIFHIMFDIVMLGYTNCIFCQISKISLFRKRIPNKIFFYWNQLVLWNLFSSTVFFKSVLLCNRRYCFLASATSQKCLFFNDICPWDEFLIVMFSHLYLYMTMRYTFCQSTSSWV